MIRMWSGGSVVLLHNKLFLGLAPADTRVHNYPFNDSDQIYQDKKIMQNRPAHTYSNAATYIW